MGLLRLNHKFYSFRIDDSDTDGIIEFKTYFQFVYHQTYKIPQPLRFNDALNKLISEGMDSDAAKALLNTQSGYFVPDDARYSDYIYFFGKSEYANTKMWIMTISINDVIVTVFDPRYKGIIDPVIEADSLGRISGRLKIKTSSFGAIAKDAVIEITMMKIGDPWSPWIFYGNSRPELATKLGRTPTGIGGVDPSQTPAMAMTFKYFLDSETNQDFRSVLINLLPSAQIVSWAGFDSSSSSLQKIYAMFDIIDGRKKSDGTSKVLFRSSTEFSVSSMSMNQTIGGISFEALSTDLLADSYSTLNYKTLPYKEYTYKEKSDLINNSSYFIVIDADKSLNDFYIKLISAYNTFINKYINPNVRFFIYKITRNNGINLSFLGNDFTLISSAQESNETRCCDYTNIFKFVIGEKDNPIPNTMYTVFQNDVNNFILNNTFDPRNHNYSLILLSDFDWEFLIGDIYPNGYLAQDLDNTKSSYLLLPKDIECSVDYQDKPTLFKSPLNVLGGAIWDSQRYHQTTNDPYRLTDGDNTNDIISFKDFCYSNISSILAEENTIKLYEPFGFACFVVGFLKLLSLKGGNPITSENDLIYTELDKDGKGFVNPETLKNQCVNSLVSVDFLNDITDGNNDNVHNLIDRIILLYKQYSYPMSNDNYLGSDIGAEMRFWRKICPIGQIYKVKGVITYFDQLDNLDYLIKIKVGNIEYELKVIIETGANISSSNISIGNMIELQGQLLYPKYFINKKNDPRGSYMDFSNPYETAKWYRLTISTVRYLMDQLNNGNDDIYLIVRSNIYVNENSSKSLSIPNYFEIDKEMKKYNVSHVLDYVDDYVYNLSQAQNIEAQLLPGEEIECFNYSNSVLVLNNLVFDMEIFDSLDLSKNFKYDIYYVMPDNNRRRYLTSFYSDVLTNTGKTKNTINISLSSIKTYQTYQKKDVNQSLIGRYYEILFGDNSFDSPDRRVFTWDRNLFKISNIYLNTLSVSWQYDNESGETESMCVVSPENGSIIFNDIIDSKKFGVTIELINISDLDDPESYNRGTYQISKVAKALYLIRSSTDNQNAPREKSPKFSFVKVNIGSSTSIERVDCQFFNTLRSFNHLICPTYGFVYFANASNWSLYPFNDAKLASGSYGKLIQGELSGPFVYFDAFAPHSDLEYKIADKTNETLITIDRIYCTATSRTQPMLHYEIIGYEKPASSLDKVQKLCIEYSKVFNRFTIIYNEEDCFKYKFSFIEFAERTDTADENKGQKYTFREQGSNEIYIRRDLRECGPISSDKPVILKDPIGYGFEPFVVNNTRGKLIGLKIDGAASEGDNVLELLTDKHVPFGYAGFEDEIMSAKRIPIYYQTGYSRIPYKQNTSNLMLYKPLDSECERIENIYGEYVIGLVNGNTPQLFETERGDYFLVYLNGSNGESNGNNRICCLQTVDKGRTWKRPNVNEESAFATKPISIYENNNGMANLIYIRGKHKNVNHIYFYNNDTKTIDLLRIPSNLFRYLFYGYNEHDQTSSHMPYENRYNLYKTEDGELVEQLGVFEDLQFVCDWKTAIDTSKYSFPVYSGGTQKFSIDKASNGKIFMMVITQNDTNLRLLVSNRTKNPDEEIGLDMVDMGINFLDPTFDLGQALKDEFIRAITIKYNEQKKVIYLFIATNNKLLLYMIFLGTFNIDFTEKDKSLINENNIIEIKSIKPYLIVGSLEEKNDYIISNNRHINEPFTTPQMVSVGWTSNNNCLLLYFKNSKIRAITSYNMVDWVINYNV
jgi:hypothetical protein